jgi:alpha-N-arabinofuranosidase
MDSVSRRRFLETASKTGIGVACGAGLACGAELAFGSSVAWGEDIASAEGGFPQTAAAATRDAARIYVDTKRTIAQLDRNLFGSFLEHLGRAIYEGVYDPQSKLADSNGFRKDVLEEIRKLGVPIIRYPGGNFVSGYNWLDGIGPKENRPPVLDKAWNSVNSNRFGTDEFLAWCRAANTEPLLAVNLGTGTPEEAAALVEYCNVAKGTRWSDLRRKNGVAEPYKVQHWCLGNEMDGPWQIGHMSASEYGAKAADAGRQMRYIDGSLKLVACGSSGPGMPTYLEWDRQVLEECYDYVDAISLHRYLGNSNETGGDYGKFLTLNLSMEKQIEEVGAVCDYVRGRKRSPKKLWLSFDEWNVWYRARGGAAVNGNRQSAPHLLEEIYDLGDALLVGGMLNSLIRKADRVKIGCLAQLVNVIAPMMTNANGLYRQTIYYPYSWALQGARGSVLEVLVESPTHEVSGAGVASVDVAATFESAGGNLAIFILNRDVAKPHEVQILWEDGAPHFVNSQILTGSDLKATNTFESPNRVVPQPGPKPSAAATSATLQAPAQSYTMLQFKV